MYQCNDEGLFECSAQCISVMMVCFNAVLSVSV